MTTRTPYMLASGGSTRIAAQNGKDIDWAWVLAACNAHESLLADNARLRAALEDWQRMAESASKSPSTNRAWVDYRDLCAQIGNTRAALAATSAQTDKGE